MAEFKGKGNRVYDFQDKDFTVGVLPTLTRFTPTTGQTITMPNTPGDQIIIVSPATDLAALTLAWASSPYDGQKVQLLFTKNITSLSHTGGSLNRSVSSAMASGDANFIYDATNSTWMSDGMTMSDTVSLVFAATTAGGAGNAVFYPTSDLTVNGTALFSSIKHVQPAFDVSNPNDAFAKPVVSNGNKTVTINCQRQVFNGVVILSINVLGSNTVSNAPNGIALTVLVHGVLA